MQPLLFTYFIFFLCISTSLSGKSSPSNVQNGASTNAQTTGLRRQVPYGKPKGLFSFFPKITRKLKSQLMILVKQEEISSGQQSKRMKRTPPNKPSVKGQTISPKSSSNRLLREAQSFFNSPPKYLELEVDSKDIRSWTVSVTGPPGTIYAGDKYRLKMEFPKDYPSKPPVVYFLKPVPRHVHVYSNGDICLDLLGRAWNPMLSAESLALSILSMLSSAKEKSLPLDNANHACTPPGKQGDNWMYHDDKC